MKVAPSLAVQRRFANTTFELFVELLCILLFTVTPVDSTVSGCLFDLSTNCFVPTELEINY